MPALILKNIPQLTLTNDLWVTILIPWLILAISVALVMVIVRLLNWDRQTTAVLLLLVPLGNTSFLGIPMVQAYYGSEAVNYALMYDQFGSFFALALYGSFVLAFFDTKSDSFSTKIVLLKIISFPPFIALVIALMLLFIKLPQMYFKILSPLAETLVPVVMVAVGYQLQLGFDKQHRLVFIVGLGLKMLVAPLIVYLIFFILNLDGLVYQVTIFESAMPPMISAGALAIMANMHPKLVAAMLAYGILLAFITLPIVYHLVL